MRNYIFAIITSFLLIANTASAAVSYSQSVTLEPGWSIVSTPRILESHTFSASSSQFSIFTLDPARPSGWATMADLGQTEFTPLYGYFINNQTATSQILTFNYKASTTPNERLFDRSFATSGWYAIGVANPSYAKFQGADIIDTDNPEDILSIPGVSAVVDFTDASYSVNPDSLAVDGVWKTATSAELSTVNDLRETKGYAVFVSTSTTLSGMQSEFMPACLDGVDNDGDSRMDYVLGPTFDFGCSSPFDTDEYNLPAGSLSVEKSQLYASQQVIVPAVDQKIGEFIVHTGNDTMYIGAVVVDLQNSSTTLSVLTDLYFTQDGTATPQYATGTAQMVWFGEGETFLPNSSTTISVFATLPESMPAGDTIIPKLFVAAISLNSGDIVTSEWVIGQTTTATSTTPIPPPQTNDGFGPHITALSITPTTTIAGGEVTFSVTAEDPDGIGNITFDIRYPDSPVHDGPFYLKPNCNYHGANSGTCSFRQDIDSSTVPTIFGEYVIEVVHADDSAGNVAIYYPNGTVTGAQVATHNFIIPTVTITP